MIARLPFSNASLFLLTIMLGAVLAATSAVLAVKIVEDRSPAALALMAGWAGLIGLATIARSRQTAFLAIGLVVAASLALRLHAVQFVTGVALGADPMNYTNIAHALLEGRGMIVDDWRYGDDLRAYFPPLFPFLLAGWWWVLGDSAHATLAFNTLIDAGSALALWDILRRMGQARAGQIAGLLFFAYPSFALGAPIPHKEALTILLAILLLRSVLIWLDDRAGGAPWRHALPMGALWALLALAQPSLVLAPLAVAIVLLARRGVWPVLQLGLMAAPAFLLVMAPWWIRNAMLFGTFVPFTTASGFMRNVSLGLLANPIMPEIFRLPEPERSAVMARLANARVAEFPLGFLIETAKALATGFAYEEVSLARFRHTTPPISMEERRIWTAPLQFGWFTLLAGAIASVWARRDDPGIRLLAQICLALFIAILAVGMWFEFGERHRYILTPLLVLIGASGLAAQARPEGQHSRHRANTATNHVTS